MPHTPEPPDAIVRRNDGARLLAADLTFAKTIAMPDLASLLLSAERVVRL